MGFWEKFVVIIILVLAIAWLIIRGRNSSGCNSSSKNRPSGPLRLADTPHAIRSRNSTKMDSSRYKASELNGSVDMLMSKNGKMATYTIEANNLSSPISSAYIIENNEVLQDITKDFIGDGVTETSTANGMWRTTPAQAKLLRNGQLYVKICTKNKPKGELTLPIRKFT